MPNGHGQFPSWLEDSQRLANRSNRTRKEHHPEAADYGIECVGWERQALGRGQFELCILQPAIVSGSPGSGYHFRNGIDPINLALGSHQGSYSQCRLSGTHGNIQDCVPTVNQCILDQSLRYWRKHLTDDFAMLLPERRGATPAV